MSERPSILVVDDEEQILRVLKPTLEAQGLKVALARTGEEALALLQAGDHAVMILDLGLPDMDGKEVIRRARMWSQAPIIVLSARQEDAEKISALDQGAEDYLAKPFSAGELMARVRVALRNWGSTGGSQRIVIGGLDLDLRRRVARLPHGAVSLSGRECQFLRLLAESKGDVVPHRELILAIWGDLDRADAQFVRVLAGQVRQKVEANPSAPRIVLTAPGVGYRLGSALEAPSDPQPA